jgi:hypothetical protein
VRFAGYVDAITVTLGHADRAAPFRSYCAALLFPSDRKNVELIAARIQPERVRAALHHFVAGLIGRVTRSRAPFAPMFYQRSSGEDRSAAGLSMIPGYQSMELIRSAWRGNIVASWKSRITARSP